jgi:dihydroorotase-like cyclic amidohydrolase
MSGEEFSTPAQSRPDLAEEKLEEEITGISQEEIPTTRTRRALVFSKKKKQKQVRVTVRTHPHHLQK